MTDVKDSPAMPDDTVNTPSTTADTGGAQTVDRALGILVTLGSGARTEGWTVSELAKELGWSRPALYRMMRPLENRRFVRKSADGRYSLGLAILELSSSLVGSIAGLSAPALRSLADATGATAHLTIVDGGEAVAIAVSEPSRVNMSVAYRAGSRHPLDVGASGRALLRGRDGASEMISSHGELEAGAYGYAVAMPTLPHIEASIGVVSLSPLDTGAVEPALRIASAEIERVLRTPETRA
ncbi:MAG: IclR family transcriptional regulator [Microbacterium sp.]|nr:MAG: IclR family transcriptional regulator [Microbacterium sp.]